MPAIDFVEDAPGMVEPGNIDLNNRPRVRNSDGSISTVRSIGVNIDNQEVLIPTVSDDGRILSNDDAVKLYRQSGKHLGKFKDAKSSDEFAKSLHEDQARIIGIDFQPDEPSETDKAAASMAQTRALVQESRQARASIPTVSAAGFLPEAMHEQGAAARALIRPFIRSAPGFTPAKPGGVREGVEESITSLLAAPFDPTVGVPMALTALDPPMMIPYWAYQGGKDVPEAVAQTVTGETPSEKVQGGLRTAMDLLMLRGGMKEAGVPVPGLPRRAPEMGKSVPFPGQATEAEMLAGKQKMAEKASVQKELDAADAQEAVAAGTPEADIKGEATTSLSPEAEAITKETLDRLEAEGKKPVVKESLPTEPTPKTETEAKAPEWLKQNLAALAAPLEVNGVADKIESLSAERKTANEIAKALGIEPAQVRAVRARRGIPPSDTGEFEDWLKSKTESKPNETKTEPGVGQGGTEISPAPAVSPGRIEDVRAESGNAQEAGGETIKLDRGISGLRRLNQESERTGPDILQWMANNMRMMSKTAARQSRDAAWWKANGSLYDDAPARLQQIHHNSIYGGSSMPDQVAQAAYEAGQIKQPSTDALWSAIDRASKTRASWNKIKANEQSVIAAEIKQHEDWSAAIKKKGGKIEVTAEDLAPGDLLEVEGERIKVTARDSETGDLTLEDGRKFGQQTLAEGKRIYVEKLEQAEGSADFLPEEKPIPKLRTGEKATGELFQGENQPFNLAGEKATDAERVQREKEQAAKQAADAKAAQEKAQLALIPEPPKAGAEGEGRSPQALGITPGGQEAVKLIGEKLASIRAKLANSWATRGNKADIARLKDAADTTAKIEANQQGRSILLEARKTFGAQARQALRAVVPVIESGGDRTRLAQFIAQSTGRHLEATKAAQFAEANWDRLQPLANKVKTIHDAQIAAENANGIATEYRENYIKHAFDVDKLPNRGQEFFGGGGGAGTKSGFKAARKFETVYDAIEAGYGKALKSLDADRLTESRLASGQQLINDRQWVNSFRNVTDHTTGKPLIEQVTFDKNHFPIAPPGYDAVTVLPGQFVAVHNGYRGIFDAVTGGSRIAGGEIAGLPVGSAILNTAAGIKHGLLLFDTFHASRIMQKQFFLTGRVGWNKGLSLLEYADADLAEAVRQGEITQEMANYARAERPKMILLTRNGLNVGRIQEALRNEVVRNLPVVGTFNRLVFDKITRGAMMEAAITELDRVTAQNPGLTPQQIAAKVAKNINVTFGNIGRQGLFKSRTMQDLGGLVALAPQWVGSMARSELGGFRDLGKVPIDLAMGKGLQVGTLGKTMAGGLLAYVVGTQLLNLATRQQFTWQNKEEGHKLDAWIPDVTGKTPGFFLNPLSVVAELTHDAYRYAFKKDNALEVGKQIVENKASPLARSVGVLWSGKNYSGEKIDGTWNRIKEAGAALVPAPIPVSGFNSGRPGQAQRQLTASAGIKTEPAPTAVKQISDKAAQFTKDKGKPKEVDLVYHADSPHNALRSAIARGDDAGAMQAIETLRKGQTDVKIFQSWRASLTHPFTGSQAMEGKFRQTLSADDRKVYEAAKQEKQEAFKKFQALWARRARK